MGKLTGKGKNTVKVKDHSDRSMVSTPVTVRGEYKYRIFERHLKLKDQQLKMIMYIQRLLYQKLLVTTNQKSVILNRYTKKRKRNPNTALKIVIITRAENKKGKEEKRPTKTNAKQLTKWQ